MSRGRRGRRWLRTCVKPDMLRDDGGRGGKEEEIEDRLSVAEKKSLSGRKRGAGTREEDKARMSIEPSADGISSSGGPRVLIDRSLPLFPHG